MERQIILKASKWEEIREQFSEPDKADLRAAVIGESICPRAWVIDLWKIEPELRAKLETALNINRNAPQPQK